MLRGITIGRRESISSEDRLAKIERKVQNLTVRQEISDFLERTSRGNNRVGEERIVGSDHPDGRQEMGRSSMPGPE